MKKHFISLFAVATIALSGCSGSDDSSDTSPSDNKIVGTWESWKEVTDDGQTFELIENGCATYADNYKSDGTGSEKYFSSWTDCSVITSDNIKWQSLGNDDYKLSTPDGSFSVTHHFTFLDNDHFIQRDEENESNIYFKRKIN